MRTRRFKKPRAARTVFLVVCEGETEKNYIELLRSKYRLPITIKTKVSGQSINQRLVRQYINELSLTNEDEYRVFYVYDGDIEQIVHRLNTLSGTPIISTPCIELWFLLHVKEHNKAVTSDSIVKTLAVVHPHWRGYAKGMLSRAQSELLLANTTIAIARATKLNYPNNPSSNFSEFISALENGENA